MQHAATETRRAGGGSVVDLASVSGMTGQANIRTGYNGAKAAINVMTKSAGVQYAEDGIRGNSVHLGMLPRMRSGNAGADPAAMQKRSKRFSWDAQGAQRKLLMRCCFLRRMRRRTSREPSSSSTAACSQRKSR